MQQSEPSASKTTKFTATTKAFEKLVMGRAKRHGGEDPDPPPPPPGPPPDPNLGLFANPLGNQFAPLLGANPLILATLANPAQPSAAIPQGSTAEPEESNLIDPDVQELCEYFHIEERHARRLNEIMKNRRGERLCHLENIKHEPDFCVS